LNDLLEEAEESDEDKVVSGFAELKEEVTKH